ncbi:Flp family type IVb pilin [Zavarzinia sp.]|uniref:Flp family type IVb pilin n=1 Tax=Zavarzinia sp. TaxID=2027920 RepID=UPI003BB67C62
MIKAVLCRRAGQGPGSPNEQGATSLEYVFIASLISLVVFLVVFQIGDWVAFQFGRMVNAL